MDHVVDITSAQMLRRLLIAAVIGGVIGFERRARHKPIGIAGMMLVAIFTKSLNTSPTMGAPRIAVAFKKGWC